MTAVWKEAQVSPMGSSEASRKSPYAKFLEAAAMVEKACADMDAARDERAAEFATEQLVPAVCILEATAALHKASITSAAARMATFAGNATRVSTRLCQCSGWCASTRRFWWRTVD